MYKLSDGTLMNWPSARRIAEEAVIPEDEISAVADFVNAAGLIEFKTAGGPDGPIALTTYGVTRAEEIIDERERGGVPLISGLVPFTSPTGSFSSHLSRSSPILERRSRKANSIPDARADGSSDVESVNDQLRAVHPNRGIIRAAFERIKKLAMPTLIAAGTTIPAVDVILRRLGR
jgi:hypothetical protein